jgi:HSP20 family protein
MSEITTLKNGPVEKPEVARSAPQQQHQRIVVLTPHVDILELPEELVLYLDMPGVKAEEVDVHFERGELTVKGKRNAFHPRAGTCLVDELEVGDYYRAFLISQDIAADRITAEVKNGVLMIRLPRADAALPRKIAVKGA